MCGDVTFFRSRRYIIRMELETFTSTIIPLRQKLLSYARKMLNNENEAEDSVQETFLRLWSIRFQLVNHPNVEGYAMQTLKNICIDKLRKDKGNTVNIEYASCSEEFVNPHTRTEINNSVDIIRQIIGTLPEIQRKIITMRDIEGYELTEIAAITGSEMASIRVNLSRARKKVRDKYISINNAIM